MKRFLLSAVAAISCCAQASVLPTAGPGDARIKWVRYDSEQVVDLRGCLGFQFSIEFAGDERIQNVSIGDSLGWQVTPNHAANILFLKPMRYQATTNMIVVTDLRHYTFSLAVVPKRARSGCANTLFDLQFNYPVPAMATVRDLPKPQSEGPRDLNHDYSYEGSIKNLPDRVFDDGHFTYFGFGDATELPAIFIADEDRDGKKDKKGNQESMAATSFRDGYVVIDQLAPRFVLRRGDKVTTIINDGFKPFSPGPLSPRPHSPRKRR